MTTIDHRLARSALNIARAWIFVLVFCVDPPRSLGDELELNDGTIWHGEVTETEDGYLLRRPNGTTLGFRRDRVAEWRKTPEGKAPPERQQKSERDPSLPPSCVVFHVKAESSAGKYQRGHLVLTDLGAPSVRACFLWSAKGGRQVELAVGSVVREENRLLLGGIEVRGGRDLPRPSEYSATIDRERGVIEGGVRAPARGPTVSWEGRRASSPPPGLDRAAIAWLRSRSERQLFHRMLSSDVKVGSRRYARTYDLSALLLLARGEDAEVARLARFVSALDVVQGPRASVRAFSPEEICRLRRDIANLLLKDASDFDGDIADSFRRARDVLNNPDGALNRLAALQLAAAERGVQSLALANELHRRQLRYLRESSPAALDAGTVTVRFLPRSDAKQRISRGSAGVLHLTHRRELSLDGVAVALRVRMDRARVASAWRKKKAHWQRGGALGDLFGLSREQWKQRFRADELRYKALAKGRGDFFFVDEWPAGVRIEIRAELISSIEKYVDEIEILVASDEGHFELPALSGDALRKSIERAKKSQARSDSRRKSKKAKKKPWSGRLGRGRSAWRK